MPHIIVRFDEIYESLWQKPMKEVAAQYDATHHQLKVFCTRYGIPTPPLGYWNKAAAGLPLPVRPSLPENRNISGTLYTGAKQENEIFLIRRAKKLEHQRNFKDIEVARRLNAPHEIVNRFLRGEYRWRQAHPLNTQFFSPPFSNSTQRALRILDAVLKALESNGYTVREGYSWWIEARSNAHNFEFRVREQYRQVKRMRPKPDKNSSAVEHYFYQKDPNQMELILEPKGIVELVTDTQKKWADNDKSALELQLSDILSEFMTQRDIAQKRAETLARDDHARIEQAAVLEKQRIVKAQEQASWEAFVSIARAWNELSPLRDFYAALISMPIDDQEAIGDRTAGEWKDWLRNRLEQADPLSGGASQILKRISSPSIIQTG